MKTKCKYGNFVKFKQGEEKGNTASAELREFFFPDGEGTFKRKSRSFQEAFPMPSKICIGENNE